MMPKALPMPAMALLAFLGGELELRAAEATQVTCFSPTATAVPVSAASMTAEDPSRGYICVEAAGAPGSANRPDTAEAQRPTGAMDGK